MNESTLLGVFLIVGLVLLSALCIIIDGGIGERAAMLIIPMLGVIVGYFYAQSHAKQQQEEKKL